MKFEGQVSADVTPKDLILALIGRIGAAGGTGYAVEYAGSAIRGMSIEGRLTICNLPSSLAPRWGWSHRMKRPSNISAAGVMPPGGNMGKCRRGLASLRAIQMQCLIGSHF